MQDFDEIALAVGDAFVSSDLGSAELILAVFVAVAFAWSAAQTLLSRRRDDDRWRNGHS
jgi:hypothetical protein